MRIDVWVRHEGPPTLTARPRTATRIPLASARLLRRPETTESCRLAGYHCLPAFTGPVDRHAVHGLPLRDGLPRLILTCTPKRESRLPGVHSSTLQRTQLGRFRLASVGASRSGGQPWQAPYELRATVHAAARPAPSGNASACSLVPRQIAVNVRFLFYCQHSETLIGKWGRRGTDYRDLTKDVLLHPGLSQGCSLYSHCSSTFHLGS